MTITETLGQTWDGYVGNQTPQEFMNLYRMHQPGITIEQAVAEYVTQIPFMFGERHEVRDEETGETENVRWTQEELNDIGQRLAAYLANGQGEEWE